MNVQIQETTEKTKINSKLILKQKATQTTAQKKKIVKFENRTQNESMTK